MVQAETLFEKRWDELEGDGSISCEFLEGHRIVELAWYVGGLVERNAYNLLERFEFVVEGYEYVRKITFDFV